MNIAQKPPCRLDFILAAKAPVAVILRRGPSRSVKMILWHTPTDRFEDGDWWRGRIYEHKFRGQTIVLFILFVDTLEPVEVNVANA